MDWIARRSGFGKREGDYRTDGDIDYGRIVHSAAFRRLQGKTQILSLGDSDFYRTRLTHSLEVAQIATGLMRTLNAHDPDHPAVPHLPDQSMIMAISSAHDLGHPPFGHGGEVALNYAMRDAGGFEGNGQTLRILTRLESFSQSHGADLTRRTLLGVLKYPAALPVLQNPLLVPALKSGPTLFKTLDIAACKPPKGYFAAEQEAVDWVLAPLSDSDRATFGDWVPKPGGHGKTLHKSLDCSIMDLADDIAYGIHDFEDAIALHLVTPEMLRSAIRAELWQDFMAGRRDADKKEKSNDPYGDLIAQLFGAGNTRKKIIGALVGYLVRPIAFVEKAAFTAPLLRWNVGLPDAQSKLLAALKDFVFQQVIDSPNVQHLEFKGQQMVVTVCEALQSDPKRLLPPDAYARYRAAADDPRVICDHVAAMTDLHLMKTYERLFSPRMGSVFDRL